MDKKLKAAMGDLNRKLQRPADVRTPLLLVAGHRFHHGVRCDVVTAQRVEVGLIFQAMLGSADALDYMLKNGVPQAVAQRVLSQPLRRRGRHDASGIRTDRLATGPTGIAGQAQAGEPHAPAGGLRQPGNVKP